MPEGKGFCTQTERGHEAHILGDRDMSDETLGMLHQLIDTASELVECRCPDCDRAIMKARVHVNAGETQCIGCKEGFQTDDGRQAIVDEINGLWSYNDRKKRYHRLIELQIAAVRAIDEAARVEGGGGYGAITNALWLAQFCSDTLKKHSLLR